MYSPFRKLSRMFTTEACLNGSFLALPEGHFRTTSSNPGIDLDQVIAVMEKLRSCGPVIQQLVHTALFPLLHPSTLLLLAQRTYSVHSAHPPRDRSVLRGSARLPGPALLSHFRKRGDARNSHRSFRSSHDAPETQSRRESIRLLDSQHRSAVRRENTGGRSTHRNHSPLTAFSSYTGRW